MSSPSFALVMPRLRRSVLPSLLALATLLAIGACDGADNPLAPADDSLTPANEPAPSEAVAPDNVMALTTSQRIVFSSTRNGGQSDIYLMDPQGGNVTRLTSTAQEDETEPALSWDNQRIALVRRRQDGSNNWYDDIYVINKDGSNGHWARPYPAPWYFLDPSWSPDGSRILVTVLQPSGLSYLGWINVATGSVSFVIPARQGSHPSYDATGQKIIFLGAGYKTIEQINADGSGHKVRFSSSTDVRFPTVSRDGKKIAFTRLVGTGNSEIFVKNLVDGIVKRLTWSSSTDYHPTWSPDGSRIAFASNRSGKFQIYTMSATGGSLTAITHGTSDWESAWSH